MRRDQIYTAWMALGLSLLVAALTHCAGSQKAMVAAIEGDQARALPLSFASLEGRRDGDRVSATLEFDGSDNHDRLVIRLDLDLGPPIRLGNGTFQFRRSGTILSGTVDAPSIDFQAGQSGGMGLGGRFILLSANGTKLFRVDLPHTLIGLRWGEIPSQIK